MIVYIIGIVLCVIGGGCLGWGFSAEDSTLMIVGGCIAAVGLIVTIFGSMLGKKHVKPNRSSFDVTYAGEDADLRMQQILAEKGFVQVQYGNEPAYRLGTGFWTARKFLRYTIHEDKIIIVAWISMGMGNRPNVEWQLDDKFVGCLPKKKLRGIVLEIVQELKQNSEQIEVK